MTHELLTNVETDFKTVQGKFGDLRPVRDDYPLVSIEQGFNWHECAEGIHVPELYLVVFRSVRRDDADLAKLREFDDRAYEDARSAAGFLFYFKGQLMAGRECLSFCLWRSRDEARAASARPDHAAAASLVYQMYESYELERHQLRQEPSKLVFTRLAG